MYQNYYFIVMLMQMLLHVSAHQRHHQGVNTLLTSYLCVGVHYTKIMEYRVKKLQLIILRLGCKWIWLTVAGSSGLLWNTAQGRVPLQSTVRIV
jgi:hypothetical protein